MNQQSIISDIEARAKAVGVSVFSLCQEAGIAPTTYYRWRDGAEAKLATLNKLGNALVAREAAQRTPLGRIKGAGSWL